MADERILQIMLRLVEQPSRIRSTFRTDNEVYFETGGYFFSIAKLSGRPDGGEFAIYVYPGYSGSLGELAANSEYFSSSQVASFKDVGASAQEKRIFSELYRIVDEKSDPTGPWLDRILKDLGT